MQTLDRAQIQTVIQHLNAMLNGAQINERRNGTANRRANTAGRRANGHADDTMPRTVYKTPDQGLTAQAAPLVQPKQPKDAPRKPAQAARPVAAEWPFATYAAPNRPFAGFLWPYEIKKLSEEQRSEYYRQLHSGEIGPDNAQAAQEVKADQGKRRAPGKTRAKTSAPGKADADPARLEALRRLADLDERIATNKGEPLEIDFGENSSKYVQVMLNCLNKGMPARAAHNFAAKTAYGDDALIY